MTTFSEYYLSEKKSEFETLKDNKLPMTPEERKVAMEADAVWHAVNGPVCAIWKSQNAKGEMHYCSNTHRAYSKSPTLKGAIAKFHSFVKTTA